ncbi:DUF1682-domain-containing protein [Auriculariales sp. MPI-PUGE-AT-0066]|nr:DUF1682-domain-containing protein [Auriculariales sp. MPI-PUGE-AT-0066]
MSAPDWKQVLIPNVPPAQEYYEGFQFRWKSFVFRPAEFVAEGYVLLILAVYLGMYFLGNHINKSKANAWLEAHREILIKQFSKPTSSGDEVVQDGGDSFFNFSTGRRGVQSLHTVFTLLPRHDILSWIYQLVWSFGDLQYQPYDKVELDFTLAPNASTPNFVFAVVDKDNLKDFTTGRYDLTFPKTGDFPGVPQYTSVIALSFTRNEPAVNLADILQDPKQSRYFRSFAVTDLPLEAPDAPGVQLNEQPKHVILTLELPSNPKDTTALVDTAFALVDYITSPGKFTLRPETKTKLRKSRTDTETFLAKQFKKEDAEVAEKKRTEKRKAEEDRVAKLSAAEQKKYEEKERKKALRKAQMKGAVRSRMG